MQLLLLKLAIAPLSVLVASLVARRLGPALGGRLIGLPLTTGPFLLLLAIGPGDAVAARAAAGTVAGEIAVVTFCVGYGWLSRTLSWPAAVTLSLLLAGVSATALGVLGLPAWAAALVVLAAIAVGLVSWPDTGAAPADRRTPQRWETPLRMASTGGIVGGLGGAAAILGPYVAGVLATWPVILSVMAPTTQRSAGRGAAGALVRGSLASMAGTVVFVGTLSYTLVPLGTWHAFLTSAALLLLVDRAVAAARPGSFARTGLVAAPAAAGA